MNNMKDIGDLNLDYLELINNENNYIDRLLLNYKHCKKIKLEELLKSDDFNNNIKEEQKINKDIKEFKEFMYKKKYNLLRERRKKIEKLYENLK